MSAEHVLGGRYRVSELLGYGGMAEVRRARDLRLDRDVAVKILRSDLARDQTFQARFRREAQSAAALNHPAIVAVYDTGTDDSTSPPTPYIVMEYVEGQTLRELLRSKTRLEPHQAMRIVAEMCAALDFSHRNGIVHRDVKPGNVMITPAGRVKVMDFGIARAVSDSAATMTATAAVIGTAQYLSPEQARGESVDARSDVYAAGCVLYELLTGAPPFVGDSPVAVAYQHVREIPKAPSSVAPGISRELDAITLKALSKNPANRYQSAAAMQEDLERALTGQRIAATPIMTEEEATELISATPLSASGPTEDDDDEPAPPPKRTKLWVALGALLVAAIIAAFFIVPRLGEDEPEPVAVPTVVGMSQQQAEDELTAKGLKLGEVTKVVSSIDQIDKVVSQDPDPDDKVEKGTTVNLEIGSGPAQKTIPDVVGKTQDEVVALLEAEGLKATPVQGDSAQAAGTVYDSNPKAGESVPEGSTVTIFVSSGQLSVPNVVGQDQQTATAALNSAGFANVTITNAADPAPAGQVISQDPGPGKADATTTVTLIVSTGPEIPNVVGKTVQEALEVLATAGYTNVTQVEEETDAVAPGMVTKQDPLPGAADVTTAITITISKAPPTSSSSSSSSASPSGD